MKPESTIDFNIRWAWHSIAKLYNKLGQQHDLTMAMGFVLLNIDKEGTPSTHLGPKMGMEPRSLTRMLKTLESKGLIYRAPDPNDGRMVRIFLTDLGKRKRAISRDTVIQFNQAVGKRIPDSKLNVFFEVLQQITSIVEQENIFKTA